MRTFWALFIALALLAAGCAERTADEAEQPHQDPLPDSANALEMSVSEVADLAARKGGWEGARRPWFEVRGRFAVPDSGPITDWTVSASFCNPKHTLVEVSFQPNGRIRVENTFFCHGGMLRPRTNNDSAEIEDQRQLPRRTLGELFRTAVSGLDRVAGGEWHAEAMAPGWAVDKRYGTGDVCEVTFSHRHGPSQIVGVDLRTGRLLRPGGHLSPAEKLERLRAALRQEAEKGGDARFSWQPHWGHTFPVGDSLTDVFIQDLGDATDLAGLALDCGCLTDIPERLATLSRLKDLSLRNGRIRRIAHLDKSKCLERLDLAGNLITRLDSVSALTNLRELDLRSNPLALPPSGATPYLPRLQTLCVDDTVLMGAPLSLRNLPALKRICLPTRDGCSERYIDLDSLDQRTMLRYDSSMVICQQDKMI